MHKKLLALFAIILFFFILFLMFTERGNYWLSMPLYSIFSNFFYGSYYVALIKTLTKAIIWAIILFCGVKIFLYEKIKSISSTFNYLFFLFIFVAYIAFLGKKIKQDFKYVIHSEYFTTDSNLSKIYKQNLGTGRGRKTHYYIENNTVKGKFESKNNPSSNYNIYEQYKLDAYQYYKINDLKEQYEKQGYNPENIKIKLYYFPESRKVFNYEIMQ